MDDAYLEIVKKAIEEGDQDVLAKLYQAAEKSKTIHTRLVLQLWYGLTKPDVCTKSQLAEMANALAEKTTGIGFLEIQNKYVESLTKPVARTRVSRLFTSLYEAGEREQGMDITEMSRENAIATLEALLEWRREQIRIVIADLYSYNAWRISNGHCVSGFFTKQNKSAIATNDIPLEKAVEAKLFKNPAHLLAHVEQYLPLDQGYLAPVSVALEWMGFSAEEMVGITNDEVDLDRQIVRGTRIPSEFTELFRSYTAKECVPTPKNKYDYSRYKEDIGKFLKRLTSKPNGKPITRRTVSVACQSIPGLELKNVLFSGRVYNLYRLERTQRISVEEIKNVFFRDTTVMNPTRLEDKLIEYTIYKKVFWNEP